jgi:putative polyhydroxyalkanoate system protein
MPDLHIRREHTLGLAEARKLAWKWAEDAEKKFSMQCGVLEGETSDTVEFQRTGVSGTLVVAADHFVLEAKLGFLLGPFSQTIEAEIRKNLDDLLGGAGVDGEAPPAKATKKKKK